jgi:hypothetical protein
MFDKMPLVMREQRFILRKEDLVTLNSGRQSTGFEDLVEQLVARLDRFLTTRLKCNILTVGPISAWHRSTRLWS